MKSHNFFWVIVLVNRIAVTGIVLIMVGILVYAVNIFHVAANSLFYPLLLGSSEGKPVIFFLLMGSLLLFNAIIVSGRITRRFAFMDIWDSRRYLKYALIIILLTYATGILIEVWLRLNFGVSLFTVFVSLNPDASSTSIIHSHVFKSIIGTVFHNIGATTPSNINTGDSLLQFISPVAYIILLTWPLTYITSLISMDNRMGHYKIIIAFATSLTMIGMIDGGIFSNPAVIGFAGLIGMYYIKEPFSPRNLIKPTLIVLLVILAGLSLEIAGSNTDYHQVTLIHQTEPINWNGYDILSTENTNQTINIKYSQNDNKQLINLFKTIKGKADGFFITWNFYSYF